MKKLIKILLSSVLLTTSSFAYADLNVLNLSYRTGPFATAIVQQQRGSGRLGLCMPARPFCRTQFG